MALLDDDPGVGLRTIGGVRPPPAPQPQVVDRVGLFTRVKQFQEEQIRREQEERQRLTELQRLAYNYDRTDQAIRDTAGALIPQAVNVGEDLLAQRQRERLQQRGGFRPENVYQDPGTAQMAQTLGQAQEGTGGLRAALAEFPDLAEAYNRIPDRVQNALPYVGVLETAQDKVPGFEQLQRGAVATGGAIARTIPYPTDYIPGLDTRQLRGRAAEEIARTIFPVEAWEVALTLAPAAKAKTVGEAIAAVTLGDTDMVSAVKAGAKRVGLTDDVIERGIRTLQSGEGALRLGKPTTDVASTVDTEVDRFVHEPELLFPDDTALAKAGKPRLLPYAQSLEAAGQQLRSTPGSKIAGGLAKIPGMKQTIAMLNRSGLAESNPAEALTVLYRRILNQGEQGVHYAIDAYMRDKGFPFEIGAEGIVRNLPDGSRFGPKPTQALTAPGTKTGGFEGENIIDILERSTRADVGKHLTNEQWDWIVTARTLIDDALDDLITAKGAKGKDQIERYFKKLGFQPGEHYFPRNVIGREGVQGARDFVRVGGIGSQAFYDRSRIHQYVAEGLAKGLDYNDPRVALENYLMALRRQTADEYLLQIARQLGKTRKELGITADTFAGAMSGAPFGREGVIPTRESVLPGLRGRIFPADLIDSIEARLTEKENRLIQRINTGAGFLRTTKAGFDAGAPLIQGLPLLFRNQAAWGRATALHYAALADPTARSRWLQSQRQYVQDYLDWGGEFTTPEFFDAARTGHLLEKVARRPAAAMDTFLDAGRLEMWKAFSGASDVDKPMYMGIVRDIVGTPSMSAAGIAKNQTALENAVMWFSSRLTKSPVALAGHILGTRKGAQEALRTYGQFLGGVSLTMLGLAKAAGMSDSEIKEMFDPRAGRKFMSIRLGQNYVGIGGAYRSLLQLAGMSYDAAKTDPKAFVSWDFERNPLLRWFRSRTAPFTGTAITLATGYDYTGRKVDDWQDRLRVIAQAGTPFIIDSAVEAEGSPQDKAIAASLGTIGLRTVPLSSGNWLDIYRDREAQNQGFSDFDAMKRQLGTPLAISRANENADVKKWHEQAQKDGQIRRQERGEMSMADVLEPFREEQAQADQNPDLSDPQAWIEDHRNRRQRQAGALALWGKDNPDKAKELRKQGEGLDPFNLPPEATPDEIRAAQFKIFDSHTTETGGVDDQEALSNDLDRFTAALSPEQQAGLEANSGLQNTEREKAYAGAVKVMADAGYFDRVDTTFDAWVEGLKASSAPAEIKQAAETWDDPNDLYNWARQDQIDNGGPQEYYTLNPRVKAWNKYFDTQNQQFLATNPEADLEAILWGYQQRVHSAEAAQLYRERTGQNPPLPR